MREFVRMGAEAGREAGEGREVTRVEDAVAEKFGHGVWEGERRREEGTIPAVDGWSLYLRFPGSLKKKMNVENMFFRGITTNHFFFF